MGGHFNLVVSQSPQELCSRARCGAAPDRVEFARVEEFGGILGLRRAGPHPPELIRQIRACNCALIICCFKPFNGQIISQ